MEKEIMYVNPEQMIVSAMFNEVKSGNIDGAKKLKTMLSLETTDIHSGIKRAMEHGLFPGTDIVMGFLDKNGSIIKGKVTEYRTRIGGLYCAERYPVNVLRHDINEIFEYSECLIVPCVDYSIFDRFKDTISLEIALCVLERNSDSKYDITALNKDDEFISIKPTEYIDNYNENYLYEIKKKDVV